MPWRRHEGDETAGEVRFVSGILPPGLGCPPNAEEGISHLFHGAFLHAPFFVPLIVSPREDVWKDALRPCPAGGHRIRHPENN